MLAYNFDTKRCLRYTWYVWFSYEWWNRVNERKMDGNWFYWFRRIKENLTGFLCWMRAILLWSYSYGFSYKRFGAGGIVNLSHFQFFCYSNRGYGHTCFLQGLKLCIWKVDLFCCKDCLVVVCIISRGFGCWQIHKTRCFTLVYMEFNPRFSLNLHATVLVRNVSSCLGHVFKW